MKKLIVILILAFATIVNADYLGSWKIDDTLQVMANMHRFSSGAEYAATGDVDLWVYEDNNATQIQDLTMDAFDSITGLYEQSVVLSAANGFEAGKHYTVLVRATVDSVAGHTTHNFQILAAVDTQTVVGATPFDSSANPVIVGTINANVITATSIAADAIGSSEIATDAIGAAEIAADAVGASEIATDAIGAAEIAANALTTAEIATGAIGADEIADNAIDAGAIAANAIGAAEVADAAIDNATFAADVGSTAYATNIIALAMRKALDILSLDNLAAVDTGVAGDADLTGVIVDGSILSHLLAIGADTSDYNASTDSQEAIRNRGDSAWTTGAGGSGGGRGGIYD